MDYSFICHIVGFITDDVMLYMYVLCINSRCNLHTHFGQGHNIEHLNVLGC